MPREIAASADRGAFGCRGFMGQRIVHLNRSKLGASSYCECQIEMPKIHGVKSFLVCVYVNVYDTTEAASWHGQIEKLLSRTEEGFLFRRRSDEAEDSATGVLAGLR
jgi:hypothetical protein